jgi:hypothetical protein
MHKSTKACEIPMNVKKRVWERDGHRCVICGSTYTAAPNAHYIPRSHLGLGIEQNIVTLCLACHCDYDNSVKRPYYAALIRMYLKRCYPDWDESKLVYRKFDALQTYHELSDKGKADVDNYIKLTYKEEHKNESHYFDW